MKRYFQIKSIDVVASDVDLKSNTVTGYFSRFGNVDSDGDMLVPGAFTKSIKERGTDGANLIVHLADHKMDTGNLLSKPKLWEAKDGGMFESTISDTTKGRDILKQYRDGLINQHSFGFKTLKNTPKGSYNEISETMVYEISTVVLGANDQTPFTGFKGLKEDEILARYELLQKCWRDGDYSDEVFPIIKAQILEIEQEIIQRYISLKAIDTTLPVATVNGEQIISMMDRTHTTKPDGADNWKAAIQLIKLKNSK